MGVHDTSRRTALGLTQCVRRGHAYRSREELRVPDTPARPTLLQRAVLWILHALMFYVVALYPVLLMARFQPDDVVHYGFLRWIAVVLVLYWAALQLFFTERPIDTRPGRQTLAVTAGILLVLGAFTPIVSFPFVGDVDFFREGYGDGYILLAMAGLSVALAITGRWKQVLVPGLGSLAVVLWTFLGVQDTISQARSGVQATLAGSPHEGLAASVMQSIQWEWGWLLLFAGSGLLVYSAARRDEFEAAPEPFVPAPLEEQPEAAPTAAPAEATVEEPASVAAEEPAAQAAAAGEAEAAGAKEPDATAGETEEPEPAAAEPAAAATEQPEEATTETAAEEGPAAADEASEPEPQAEARQATSTDVESSTTEAPAPAVEPEAQTPASEPGDTAAGSDTEASAAEPAEAGSEKSESAEAAPAAGSTPAEAGGQASADVSGGGDQASAEASQSAPAESGAGEADESDSGSTSAAKKE